MGPLGICTASYNDCHVLLTSSLVLLRLYPQFMAMSMGCISVQPSAVQVLERLPRDGDDIKRSEPPRQ